MATKPIPVNPNYDTDVPPEDQEFAYVNPVTLNVHQIELANEMARLADVEVKAKRDAVAHRLEKKKLERQVRDLEEALLANDPLKPTEAKNLQTTAAAIRRRAIAAEQWDTLTALRQQIHALEDLIETADGLVDRARVYWTTAQHMNDAIKTHLAYVKDEWKRAGA